MLNRIALLAEPPAGLLRSAARGLRRRRGDDTGSTEADIDRRGGSPCESVDTPAAEEERRRCPRRRPTSRRPPGSTFETSCGSFTVSFDDRAPKTAASFQYLAEKGFYDDTVFHRVVPGFVIQGGDPLGTDPEKAGTGGPGYHVDEKPPADLSYTQGIVAMAKSEVEPPGRSGSQFYVVTGADAGLPPDYALVGKVTEGMDTVEAIDALGTPGADGPPTQTVVIESATPEGAEMAKPKQGQTGPRLHAALDRRGRLLASPITARPLGDPRLLPGRLHPDLHEAVLQLPRRARADRRPRRRGGRDLAPGRRLPRAVHRRARPDGAARGRRRQVGRRAPTASSLRAAPSCAGRSSSSIPRA